MSNLIATIAKKEFIHIRRDPRTLTIVVFIPIFMLTLFGYALTLDVKHIPTAVVDQCRTRASRDFISKFGNSEYFDIEYYLDRTSELKELVDSGKVDVGIVIPEDFSKDISSGRLADVQTIIDGTNSNIASIAQSYVNVITSQYWQEKSREELVRLGVPRGTALEVINYDPRFWYNPELKSMNFLVPGLICVILMMLSALLTSMSIVSEKEKGTIEGLVVSPIKTRQLVLGKMIPYALIAFFDIVLVIALGTLWFGVPLKGSLLLLLVLSFVFLFSALGIGLLVSTVARNALEAYLMAIFSTMLPTILLSGFVFPISSMPIVLQMISKIIPATYYLIIIRGIFLKGVGIAHLWPSAVALVLFGMFMVFLSIRRFSKRIT